VEVVQFNIAEYKCPCCRRRVVAKHPECPMQGRFGVRMLSLIVFLQIFMRGVTRKVPAFLRYQNDMDLSPASCSNILSRIGKVCQKEYDGLKERIRKSTVVYVDETSISVMGKRYWIWIFRTGGEVFVAIRKSRGGQVLEEVLGIEWEGVIVCDGWRAYRRLEKATLQRCWSHLIREAKDQEDTVAGRHLYQKLVLMFKEIKAFKKSESDDDMRQVKHDELMAELKKLTAYYRRYPYLSKLLTYIENGGSEWFTCILRENVEPTNNFAEQSLREMVILRNIIGAIRSENVSKYENTCSLFATWKLKKEDAFANLKKIISKQYCMS
jgi:transposase